MGYFVTSKAARVVAGSSKFGHRFGGLPAHQILGKKHRALNLHCLYLLNTADAGLPRVLKGRKWLPLYYPLFNNACEFAYEVMSETEIAVHSLSCGPIADFPYPGYLRVLSERTVRLAPLSYSQQKTLVFAFTAREFLSDSALSGPDREFLKRTGYPFTQIGGIQYMTQGLPEQPCANKKCENAKFGAAQEVFAVVWNNPVPGFQVWGEYGDYSQLIFQVCRKCATIHVCNRCD